MAKVLLTAPARLPPALVVRDKQSLSTSPPPPDSQIRDIGSQWPTTTTLFGTHPVTRRACLEILFEDFSSRSQLWSVERHVRLALLDHLEERDQEVFAEEERLCRSEGYLLGDAVNIKFVTKKQLKDKQSINQR